jgi:hypothetical protein
MRVASKCLAVAVQCLSFPAVKDTGERHLKLKPGRWSWCKQCRTALCSIEITGTTLGTLVCKVSYKYCSDFLTILTQRIKQDKTTVGRPSAGFEKFKEPTCSYCEPTTYYPWLEGRIIPSSHLLKWSFEHASCRQGANACLQSEQLKWQENRNSGPNHNSYCYQIFTKILASWTFISPVKHLIRSK